MPTITIDLDPESYQRLIVLAVTARRPIPWQAEVLLIDAIAARAPGGSPVCPGEDVTAESPGVVSGSGQADAVPRARARGPQGARHSPPSSS